MIRIELKYYLRLYKEFMTKTQIQEVIDALMIEVYVEEGISPEQVIFYFAFSLLLSLS